MKKFILILIAILAINFNTLAQMGIGRIPHNGSILDLTNSDNKFLLLPKFSSGAPDISSLSSPGGIVYYQGKIYLNDASSELKILTPWQWDGNPTGYISSNILNPIVIGTTPTVSSPYRLHIADAISPGVSVLGSSKASILIGDTTSFHLVIDNNELMAKTNATTAGSLKLQKEGGIVAIGIVAAADTNTLLRVNGSIDAADKGKIKENGNNLIPKGMIIMWKGTSEPLGWAICDGSTRITLDGGTITTPDLRERFIVGAGPGSGYAIADNGGTITNDHTHNFDLPVYTPLPATADGAHSHAGTTNGPSASDRTTAAGYNAPSSSHTHTFTTSIDGSHVHEIDVLPTNTDGASANENRPPYYALLFIMKL